MIKMYKIRKIIILMLSIPLLLSLTNNESVAAVLDEDEIRLENIEWKIVGTKVFIFYDLIGPADETYVISIRFLREDDKSFEIVPTSVTGDVGEGKFAGKGKQIFWAYRNDILMLPTGNDFYFELSVDRVRGTWLWYDVIGAVTAAGVLTKYILDKKESKSTVDETLPLPPARP